MININEGVYSFYDISDQLGNDDSDSDNFEFIEPSSYEETSLNEFEIVDLSTPLQLESIKKEQKSDNNKQRDNSCIKRAITNELSLKFYSYQQNIYNGKIKSNETLDIKLNGQTIDFQLQSNQENNIFIKTTSQILVQQFLDPFKTIIVEGPIQIGQNWIVCQKQDQSISTYEDEAMKNRISNLKYSKNQSRNIYDENGKTNKVGQILWDGENFKYQHFSSNFRAKMNLQNNSRFASDSWYLINNIMYYCEY